MNGELPAGFDRVEGEVFSYLDSLDPSDRVKGIEALLDHLHFEQRLALLTPEERAHMEAGPLSLEAKARLDAAPTESEREGLITMYARSVYFRKCAWEAYLYGKTDKKPFESSKKEGKVA